MFYKDGLKFENTNLEKRPGNAVSHCFSKADM